MQSNPSREICFLVLHQLYKQADKVVGVDVPFTGEHGLQGLTDSDRTDAAAWLQASQLIVLSRKVGEASLSTIGLATVERALAVQDEETTHFPALVSFSGLSQNSPLGLQQSTVQSWLDQLSDCANSLALEESSEVTLDSTLTDLEGRVQASGVDAQVLLLSLQELKDSL